MSLIFPWFYSLLFHVLFTHHLPKVSICHLNMFILFTETLKQIMNNFSQRKEPKINVLSVVVAIFRFFVYYMPNLAHTRKLLFNLISLNSPSLPGDGVVAHM